MIFHSNNKNDKETSIIREEGNVFADTIIDAHLSAFDELNGTLYATERIDENAYLILCCTKYYRLPINNKTLQELRPVIGSRIHILQTDNRLIIRIPSQNKSPTSTSEEIS